jgi:hypothetical protein
MLPSKQLCCSAQAPESILSQFHRMTQDIALPPSAPRHEAAPSVEKDPVFWRSLSLQYRWRDARVMILDKEQPDALTHWQSCLPEVRHLTMRSSLQSIEGSLGPFDVVIDASGQTPADAVMAFERLLPCISTAGIHVFAGVDSRGLLVSFGTEVQKTTMARIHVMEFVQGLCIVRMHTEYGSSAGRSLPRVR